ncbi:hypothetical protein FOCC_FOCC001404 [Frankliniella occidentalis]|nr:hypothetical protein FOCC_FOCC001404 [Frankliniella occidentalis]
MIFDSSLRTSAPVRPSSSAGGRPAGPSDLAAHARTKSRLANKNKGGVGCSAKELRHENPYSSTSSTTMQRLKPAEEPGQIRDDSSTRRRWLRLTRTYRVVHWERKRGHRTGQKTRLGSGGAHTSFASLSQGGPERASHRNETWLLGKPGSLAPVAAAAAPPRHATQTAGKLQQLLALYNGAAPSGVVVTPTTTHRNSLATTRSPKGARSRGRQVRDGRLQRVALEGWSPKDTKDSAKGCRAKALYRPGAGAVAEVHCEARTVVVVVVVVLAVVLADVHHLGRWLHVRGLAVEHDHLGAAVKTEEP